VVWGIVYCIARRCDMHSIGWSRAHPGSHGRISICGITSTVIGHATSQGPGDVDDPSSVARQFSIKFLTLAFRARV
jgi:hypothetical protein